MDTVVNETPVTEEPKVEEVVTESKPQPGEKTDPALLLKATQEEREKRRLAEKRAQEAEAALALLQTQSVTAPISDEGKFLDSRIQTLEQRLAQEDEQRRMDSLQTAHPALKDKSAEFEAFRSNPEYAGMKIETVAKVFLAENDLLTPQTQRKGLEKDAGGGRTPTKTGLTAEEIGSLRVNNYPEYVKRLKNGTLNN